MDKRIAVEEGLDSVGHYLKQNGYQVVPLQGEVRAGEVDCLVISGGDKNMMGMADIQTGHSDQCPREKCGRSIPGSAKAGASSLKNRSFLFRCGATGSFYFYFSWALALGRADFPTLKTKFSSILRLHPFDEVL